MYNYNYFQCLKCSFQTKWQFLIQEHINKHKYDSPSRPLFDCISIINDFQCFLCKNNFQTNSHSTYRNHIKKSHKSELFDESFIDTTNENYNLKVKLLKNVIPLTNSYKTRVNINQIKTKSSILNIPKCSNNYKNVSKDGNKIFNCINCEYKTIHRSGLRRHILSKHTTDEEKINKFLKCLHCNFKTLTSRNLKLHILSKHLTDEEKSNKSSKCLHCDFKTLYKEKLKNHILWKHSTYEEKHNKFSNCLHCDYKTFHKSRLNRHILSHHATEEEKINKSYNCLHCEFTTLRNHYLKLHVLSKHSTDKEKIDKFNKCLHCDFKTLYNNNLNVHILRKHSPDKIKREAANF